MTLEEKKTELLRRVNYSRVQVGLPVMKTWGQYMARLSFIYPLAKKSFEEGSAGIDYYLARTKPAPKEFTA